MIIGHRLALGEGGWVGNCCIGKATKLFLAEYEDFSKTYRVEFEVNSAHRKPRNLFTSPRKKAMESLHRHGNV